MRLAILLALAAALAACSASRPAATAEPVLTDQTSGTDALLIGSHAVDESVVWLSGRDGTVVRTTDGGETWTARVVPGFDTLQLRDIHALDAQTAWALSIGPGESSRIAKTTDGGASWRTVFVNDEPDGFYDCLSFWTSEGDGAANARRGLAFSDSVEGAFLVLTTADGGETWTRVPDAALPPAAEGEGSFAASGTCVTTGPDGLAWIGTGNADPARVLRTDDYGATWTSATVPLVAGEAKGIASVVFRDARHGVALGGDIAAPDVFADAVAITDDGGRTWEAGGRLPFPGAVYGAAYVPGTGALVAVGPGGVALSRDDGRTWSLVDDRTFWGITAASPRATWLVGPDGRVAKLSFE